MPDVTGRFMAKVTLMDSGCLEFQGAKDRKGYGRFNLGGKSVPAHRVAWQIFQGPIPERMNVLHKCDNPPCVRPAHLFLGTLAENNKDCARKGRTQRTNALKTHCVRGHPFDEANTYLRRDRIGKDGKPYRMCIACRDERSRNWTG